MAVKTKNYTDEFKRQIVALKQSRKMTVELAVAEATYKIIKTEFAFNRIFKSLEELKRELGAYVLWYNTKRVHGSLNYMTPVEYRLSKATE